MDREVVWSLLATADLESIVEHIFRDSEFYAAAVARELVAAARSLATFSERGRGDRVRGSCRAGNHRSAIPSHLFGCGQTAWRCCASFMVLDNCLQSSKSV
jgi:plasmid stabilization system protein ParE